MSDLTDEQTNQLELIRPERVIQWLAGALVTDKLLQYAEILEDEYMLRRGFVPVDAQRLTMPHVGTPDPDDIVFCGVCDATYTCLCHVSCPGFGRGEEDQSPR